MKGAPRVWVSVSTVTCRSSMHPAAPTASWGSAVDLVAQHDVGEDRAGLELEVPGLLTEDVDPGDVGRQEIGRELDPAKDEQIDRAIDLASIVFPTPGDVLDQQVPFRDQRDQGQADLMMLAPDDLLDVLLDVPEPRGERLRIRSFSRTSIRCPPTSAVDRCPILRPAPSSDTPTCCTHWGDGKFPTTEEKRAAGSRTDAPRGPCSQRSGIARGRPASRGRLHRCDLKCS